MAKKRRGRNEGSIYQTENGSWRILVSMHSRRFSKTFKNKKDAQVYLRNTLQEVDKGLTHNATRITLKEYLPQWLSVHKSVLKPRTAERYEQIYRDYILPYIGYFKLHDLTLIQIEDLYQELLKEGTSIRNVRLAHSVLHKSLKDALRRGLIAHNPANGARQPRMHQKEMQILDENQVMQFFICVQGDRNEALYHLAVKTGMRQGELLGLKWSDLDWNSGRLRVQRQAQRVPGEGRMFVPPKTRAGRRTIYLGSATLQILRLHWEKQQLEIAIADSQWQNQDLIFPSRVGTPQSGSNLLKEYKELLKRAGLPLIRFHDLRHTAASIMLNERVPPFVVSRILGHSKPSTTMDIYGHLIPATYEGIGDRMDELLTPVPVNVGEKNKVMEQNLSDST